MTRLNDLQLVLLSAASRRGDGSLLPPPAHIADQSARVRKVVPPLIKRGLVEEARTNDPSKSWREEGEDRFALIITEAGRSAIAVQPPGVPTPLSASDAPPPSPSKSALVLEMLQRKQGASLGELVAATGWLPHTTRAALTGLRKKGHPIMRQKVDETSRYSPAKGAAQ